MTRHPLIQSVARGLRRRCGVRQGASVLAAVSGGADSVALLRALCALKDRRGWGLRLTVGHVQHHLRGMAAEDDARFVEELARQLKLPWQRRDLDLSNEAGNVEAAARRARYRALRQMARGCGAAFIATAHQADDQLETLLMRLLRGAGTEGMSGIGYRVSGVGREGSGSGDQGSGGGGDLSTSSRNPIPESRYPTLIRPMLAVTRTEVLDYLRTLNQDWREDHTNADVTRWRARLREEVLPVLEAMRPGAAKRATRLARQMRDVHGVLKDAIESALGQVEPDGSGYVMRRDACRSLRNVVLSGLLRELLAEAGVPGDKLGARQVGHVVRAVRDREGGQRTFEFAQGVRVELTREVVRVVRG